MFVGAKILIFIDLSKYSSHFLHQNMIFVGEIFHKNGSPA